MADTKGSNLTALTSMASGDEFIVIDDPSGTAETKNITLTNLFDNIPDATILAGGTLDIADITDGNMPYMGASGFVDGPLSYDGSTLAASTQTTITGGTDPGVSVLELTHDNVSAVEWTFRSGVSDVSHQILTLDVAGTEYVRFDNRTPGLVKFPGTLEGSTVPTFSETNVTTDRTYDANSTTTAELADVLGTLIADLRTIGLVD